MVCINNIQYTVGSQLSEPVGTRAVRITEIAPMLLILDVKKCFFIKEKCCGRTTASLGSQWYCGLLVSQVEWVATLAKVLPLLTKL